jgi:hypothetical protein
MFRRRGTAADERESVTEVAHSRELDECTLVDRDRITIGTVEPAYCGVLSAGASGPW